MERELTINKTRRGFALVTVLVIAAVGLLFGAGALLLFRFQCQKRIDRQHEIEKYFAVRSALQLLAEDSSVNNFPDELSGPKWFVYQTDSGRDVRVIINPAEALFPDYHYRFPDGKRHFYVNFQTVVSQQSRPGRPATRAKQSVNNVTSTLARYMLCANSAMQDKTFYLEGNYLSMMHGSECANSNGIPRCWLKMDMSPTGRWSDDLFGRRYMFNVHEYCKLTPTGEPDTIITNDIYRLVLKRLKKNEEYPQPIINENWRPTQEDEAVIYAELRSWQTYTNGSYRTDTHFAAYTQVGTRMPEIIKDERGNPLTKTSDSLLSTNLAMGVTSDEARNGYGIQLAGRRLSLYQASTPSQRGPLRYDLWSNGFIPEDVYFHFTNDYSTVFSTNMVMVFEVEASIGRDGTNYIHKTETSVNEYNEYNRIANFEVYPAYEYSIDVDYPHGYTNSATFVHLDHLGLVRQNTRRAITYDAHGTLNRGWREDERDWREYNEWLRGRPNTEANRLQWQVERGKFR